jgi:hypothetical protein
MINWPIERKVEGLPRTLPAFVIRHRTRFLDLCVYPLLLLAVNLAIVAPEFKVDYSAYLESNEGSFIAIAQGMASHPGDLLWWPFWDLGLPIQSTYIPGLPLLVALFSRLTGHSASLSFHQVCALFYALGPIAVYYMARAMTGQPGTSCFAALAYSLVSPSAWLMPLIRYDMGGPLHLRRLHIMAYYGEGPYTACLFFVPLAILFLYLALTRGKEWMKFLAGLALALAVTMNAFAVPILGIASVALIATSPYEKRVRNAVLILAIATLSYLWISPLLPPSVAEAIRRNSSHEYPFNAASALGLGGLGLAFFALWFITRTRVSAPVRMFLLFTLTVSGIVLLAYYAGCNIVPQPHRYGTTMDLGLCVSVAFTGAALLRERASKLRAVVVAALVLAALVQLRNDTVYARDLIRSGDVTKTTTYRLAKWMDVHMNGARVFVGGGHSLHFNVFTDTPQFHGGHNPMQPSILTLEGAFVIYSGMNTGSHDMEICSVWLKALGVRAFSVPGPLSDPYNRPFPHPERFDGQFPVLWHESDTTIYGVPMRSMSLAHVVPVNQLVQHLPINGLDIDEMKTYVAALDDPALPEASFQWSSRHTATITAQLKPGHAVSVQERYTPGWKAVANGQKVDVEHDGLGFMVLKPDCGDCQIALSYDGGPELYATALASTFVTMFSVIVLARKRSWSQ